jgi:hypothetical protein
LVKKKKNNNNNNNKINISVGTSTVLTWFGIMQLYIPKTKKSSWKGLILNCLKIIISLWLQCWKELLENDF